MSKIHSAIESVTVFPRFQHHIQNCVTVLMGSERFQWLNGCPSWCLKVLASAGQTETMTTPNESNRNGIFLLPHERLESVEKMVNKRMKISRTTLPGSGICHNDYKLLKTNRWLNDEVLDGYTALIRSSRETVCLVLASHFYQIIRVRDQDSECQDTIKSYVSWITSLGLILSHSP